MVVNKPVVVIVVWRQRRRSLKMRLENYDNDNDIDDDDDDDDIEDDDCNVCDAGIDAGGKDGAHFRKKGVGQMRILNDFTSTNDKIEPRKTRLMTTD